MTVSQFEKYNLLKGNEYVFRMDEGSIHGEYLGVSGCLKRIKVCSQSYGATSLSTLDRGHVTSIKKVVWMDEDDFNQEDN